jgi:hypothetical protein
MAAWALKVDTPISARHNTMIGAVMSMFRSLTTQVPIELWMKVTPLAPYP